MGTTKINVTIDDVELTWLRRRAKRLHGGDLSAAVAEAARVVRKQEALRAFLDKDGVPRLTPSELAEILAEWEGSPRTGKRARKPRAA